jgi:hypothetical protein
MKCGILMNNLLMLKKAKESTGTKIRRKQIE